MAIPFMTEDWAKAFMDAINNNDAYKEAAATWEGDFYFVAELKDGSSATVYLDLWHGACRDAYEVADPDAKKTEFVLEAGYPAWKKVLEKRLDPIQGMVTRQLKLKGNMLKVMKAPKAATELVHCATLIDTAWPEA